jgi:hypothetical protein
VPGGQTFGYTNVRVNSHAEYHINETEAAVVRRIFELAAEGHWTRWIAALRGLCRGLLRHGLTGWLPPAVATPPSSGEGFVPRDRLGHCPSRAGWPGSAWRSCPFTPSRGAGDRPVAHGALAPKDTH